jgi:hypothetical protein
MGVSGFFIETADGELDNRLDLFAVKPVEPFHDVVDAGSGASMFPKIAATGIRVPRSTHAPLILPGMLSTAGHCDQSRLAICSNSSSPKRDSVLFGQGLQKFPHGLSFAALRLFHPPADAANAFEQFVIFHELPISVGALHDNLGATIYRENRGPSRGFEFLNMLFRIALKIA